MGVGLMKDKGHMVNEKTKYYSGGYDFYSREKEAEAIVRFMRGETGSYDFEDQHLFDTRDDSLRIVQRRIYLFYDSTSNHKISVYHEGWQALLRWVAFCKADYSLREDVYVLPNPTRTVAWTILGVWTFLMVLGAFLWYLSLSGLGAFVVIFGHFTLAVVYGLIPKGPVGDMSLLDGINVKYEPFLSEDDWQAHKHLIDQLGIPEYQERIHNKPRGLWHLSFDLPPLIGGLFVLPIYLLGDTRPGRITIYSRFRNTE
jgi:hypothetical protein